jgi:arabinogalactan oligomer/maltooligosaccharide transport system permease protein
MTPAPAPSHRRRFLIGLAVAALLGVGLGAFLLASAREAERRDRDERRSVVTLLALAQVVDRVGAGEASAEEPSYGLGDELPPVEGEAETGGLGDELAALDAGAPAEAPDPGEAVRKAVAAFARTHPEVKAIRVVAFEGIRLEASSDPKDVGDKAAPRRLDREEKPIYDLGQTLRAAVAGNREEGSVREDEIAVERLRGGRLRLSAPFERGGEVVGLVQMDTDPANPEKTAGGFPWLAVLLAWLAPVVLFGLLSIVLGERRALLAAAAAVLLVAALVALGARSRTILAADRRATAESVAAAVKQEGERTGALISELGLPASDTAPLAPELWDVNRYREAHGLVQSGGVLDEGRLGEEVGADAGRLTRSVIALALVSLVLLIFVGWGWAARTGAALVEHRYAYSYTVPALAVMLLLVFFPFLYGVALSFTNSNIYNTDKSVFELWVGLDNFVEILRDIHVAHRTAEGLAWNFQNFYWTLGFTVVWTIANVTIGVTLGLLLALALNTKGLALRAAYRVLLILPWAVPTYITALVWRGMFHKQFGVINQIFQMFGFAPVAWFDRPLTSFLAVLTTNGWLSFSFMMVVSLGALQSIPADLYEAARVDGATRWQQFRSITLPSLRPALIPAIILSVIWTFNQFIVIFLVSAGEPGHATEILITQAYRIAFEQYRYGYAAAYSVIIFLILLAYGSWQNRVTRATEAIGE